jgi:hypothetical protein
MGGSGIYLHSFLQHGTKQTSVVNFILHPHYPWGRGRVFCTKWIGGPGDPRAGWDTKENTKTLAVLRTKSQFLRHPACILFTIWLHYSVSWLYRNYKFYTHTHALLTEPSAQHRYYQRLPANVVPGQFGPPHIIIVHFPPVQYCPLISFP